MDRGSFQLCVDVPKHEERDYRARIDSRLETNIGPWKDSRIAPGSRVFLLCSLSGNFAAVQSYISDSKGRTRSASPVGRNLKIRPIFNSFYFGIRFREPSTLLRCWRSAHDRYDVFP